MADTYTSTTEVSDLVITAYDEMTLFQFQEQSYYDQFCDIKRAEGELAQRGNPVTFTIYDNLAAATTALTETSDVDAVSATDTQKTVTLEEFGNAMTTTLKLEETSFVKVVKDMTKLLANNMALSLDTICKNVCQAGTNVEYAGVATARNLLLSTETITAAKVEKQEAELRNDNVPPIFGNLYGAIIHPHCAYDLRRETGAAAWRAPKDYVDASDLKTGEVGEFGGFRFIRSSRAPLWSDGGSSTVDAYGTLFFGYQALGKGIGVDPKTVFGPVTDKLRRFRPLGWYALLGYGRIREDSLRRLESASSIGSNS